MRDVVAAADPALVADALHPRYARLAAPKGGEPPRSPRYGQRAVPAPRRRVPLDPAEAAFVGTAAGRANVQESGWVGRSGTRFGTEGLSRRLEALSLSAADLPWEGGLVTSVHAQDLGWLDPVGDGGVAGTTGESRRLEAVAITLEGEASAHASVWYRVHGQDYGWLDWASDGQPAGTGGMSLRAECVEVQVLPTGAVPSDYTDELAFLSAT